MSNLSQPLRVAVVASSLQLAGAEKQAFYMARALYGAGNEARFFHLGGDGRYETVLRQAGVPFRRIYFPNRPLLMLARLAAAWRRWRPHIALAVQFGDLRFAIPAGRLCRALVVGGVRSDGFYELNRYGRWSRWLFRLAHGLIANSSRARQNLTSQKINPQKIEVLPNVIDLPDFDSRSAEPLEISLSPERITVAAVGNLHACKRFDRFIDALALARQSEPALAGVIAGADYGCQMELQTHANARGLTPRDLAFLGRVSNVPALLSRSAMLALTSDYEGFPNVILEAMAARRPVITTAVGDAGRVVLHGQTGYVVGREDDRAMSAYMIRLAQSPALRQALGQAGRERVEQEYNYDSLAGRLLEIFHRSARESQRHALCELLERGVRAKKSPTISGPQMAGQLIT
jgi:glycosyltransferase involved in cell wall biosynthesis